MYMNVRDIKLYITCIVATQFMSQQNFCSLKKNDNTNIQKILTGCMLRKLTHS